MVSKRRSSRWPAVFFAGHLAAALALTAGAPFATAQERPAEEPAAEEAASGKAAGKDAVARLLLPAGLGLGLGGALAALVGGGGSGGGGGDDGTESWSRQRTALSFDRRVEALYLPGGVHHAELMALGEQRPPGWGPGYNPYLLVKAPTAYGYGATGAGQVVAVLDDGFQLDHPALAPKIASVYQRDAMPTFLHGTHVASLAAGARDGRGMFGLAFDARLHLASNFDQSGDLGFSPTHWAAATEAARQAEAVAQNNSWGVEGQGQERVRTQDVIRVAADPSSIDALAPDLRRDLLAFLDDNGIDREELRGSPLRTLTLFTQALVLAPRQGSSEPVAGWLPADWRRYRQSLQAFQDSGVVVFALSNNDRLSFADFSAALPGIFPELQGAWVAVANVDLTYADEADPAASPLLARRMSAPCAQAAAYCLSHDGSWVLGAVPADDYRPLLGTSMAAPQVTGAIAVLAQAFPDHTPEQLSARLLATAENFGDWQDLRVRRDGKLVGRIGERRVILEEEPGSLGETSFGDGLTHAHSSTYGHGFMNLASAMQPIGGPPRLPVGQSLESAAFFGLEASRIRLGPAFGDGMARQLAGVEVAAFDRLGGGFPTALDRLVAVSPRGPQAGELLAGFARRPDFHSFELGAGGRLEIALRPHPRAGLTPLRREHPRLEPAIHLSLPLAAGFGLTAWNNRSPAHSFGLLATRRLEEPLMLGRDAFANPFLGFVAEGHGGTLELGSAAGPGLRLGVFEGRQRDSAAAQADEAAEERVWGTAAELRLPLGEGGRLGGLGLTGGLLSESGTILGARTEGAFTTEGGTSTFFAGLAGRLALDAFGLRGLSLVGSANWGWTRPRAASASLISEVSTIATESFSLGLQGEALFDARDRFTLTLNQPLRVRGGSARLALPVGRNADLNLRHRSVRVGLRPSGRELSLEAAYGFRLDEATDIAGALLYRRQPGHRRSAGGEGVGLLKLQVRF